jgi:hypothetical protein
MVHCWDTSPYLSFSYPIQGNSSRRGSGYFDVPKGPSRWIKITRIGAGAIPTFKLDNVVARYGEGEGGV